mmetsp:Transcript_30560/g.98451  ORF Transcript_30560/g.98451 Transcript_30560/m.98451 type:complete len:242 (-) Transcript_30560:126-851(-)
MVERSTCSSGHLPCSIHLSTSRADVPIGEVQPQVLRHSGFFALPCLGVGGDLLAVVDLDQAVCVLGDLSLVLPGHHLRFVLREVTCLKDAVHNHGDQFGQLLVGKGNQYPFREQREEVGLLVLKLLLVDLESSLHSDGHLGRGLRILSLLGLFGNFLPAHVQVEREVRARKVQVHEAASKPLVVRQADKESVWRLWRVEAVDTLHLPNPITMSWHLERAQVFPDLGQNLFVDLLHFVPRLH